MFCIRYSFVFVRCAFIEMTESWLVLSHVIIFGVFLQMLMCLVDVQNNFGFIVMVSFSELSVGLSFVPVFIN
jgi:hypothetical protein